MSLQYAALWVCMWSFRPILLENPASHCLQVNGFSPVCVNTGIFRPQFWEILPHTPCKLMASLQYVIPHVFSGHYWGGNPAHAVNGFSLVCVLMWVFWWPLIKNLLAAKWLLSRMSTHVILQTLITGKYCSTPRASKWVLSSMCSKMIFQVTTALSVNPLPHSLHINGLSPVWVCRCWFRLPSLENPALHTLQVNRFSPVWILKCLVRAQFMEILFHTNCS